MRLFPTASAQAVGIAAALLLPLAIGRPASASPSDRVQPAAQRFDLAEIRLLPGPLLEARNRNSAYLLRLSPDRFLHYFRVEAGLPPQAPPYGGWESPTTGAGRCLGHYLSALALSYRTSGEPEFQRRIDAIVAGLAECQAANGDGYLSAQAGLREAFARLAVGEVEPFVKARVPWYIQHKMFAGLRDAHLLGGNAQAREVLVALADFAVRITAGLDDAQFQSMLEREFGGIQETLIDVYALTGDPKHLSLARRFEHRRVQDPWYRGEDNLVGLHANTQIPKAIGAARLFDLMGDRPYFEMAQFFWQRVVHHHSYVIGGNSEREQFGPPDELGRRLGPLTAETCNTYNMLRLTRQLFIHDPQVDYADYYERAYWNHILASQEPEEGMFTYFVSLKPGHFKTYSTPFDSFWCCVGTGMESHAKHGDSIYFHQGRRLYVNLYAPSELAWTELGLQLHQETEYPLGERVRFRFASTNAVHMELALRVPGWTDGLGLRLNGERLDQETRPGSYVILERAWHDGDVLDVRIPLRLRTESTPDDPSRLAFLYGPLVLGGEINTPPTPSPYAKDQGAYRDEPVPEVPILVPGDRRLVDCLEPVPGRPATFRTVGLGRPSDVVLSPFFQRSFGRYTVYWDVVTPSGTGP